MTPKRCKDCDRDMEVDHKGRPRCFACDPGSGPYLYEGAIEHRNSNRYEDTREGLKRPVKP